MGPLWRLTLKYEQKLEHPRARGWCPGFISWEPLTLGFGITQRREVDYSTLVSAYTFRNLVDCSDEPSRGKGWVRRSQGSGTSVLGPEGLGRPEFVLGRNLRFDESTKELNLMDPNLQDEFSGVDKHPNTFWVSTRLSAPGQSTTTLLKPPNDYAGPRVATMETNSEFNAVFFFPYDVNKPGQEGKATFSSEHALASVAGTGAATPLPPGERGPIDLTEPGRNVVSFSLKTERLELKYQPLLDLDMIERANGIGSSRLWPNAKHITPNLVKADDGRAFIHANNETVVLVNDEDKTDSYATYRYLREWTSERNRRYKKSKDWFDDSGGKSKWVDTPGSMEVTPEWTAGALLFEFVIGVHKYPEFKFIYFTVLVEVQPPQKYRVRMTDGKLITSDEWSKRRRSVEPLWDGTVRVTQDTGWWIVHGDRAERVK